MVIRKKKTNELKSEKKRREMKRKGIQSINDEERQDI